MKFLLISIFLFITLVNGELPPLNDKGHLIKTKVKLRCEEICENCHWFIDLNGESHNLTFCRNNDLFVENSFTSVDDIVDTYDKRIESITLQKIKGLKIQHAVRMNYIPKNIGTFLRKLEGLWIEDSNLLFIERMDFNQFYSDLQFLHLHNNKLSSLDSHVFASLPNLKVIFIQDNPIKYIGQDILGSLRYLQQISFTKCSDKSNIENFNDRNEFNKLHGCNFRDWASFMTINQIYERIYNLLLSSHRYQCDVEPLPNYY